MLSSTAKGREVRGYYIKMEKVLKAYLKAKAESMQQLLVARAAAEARLQLENQRLIEDRAAAESAQEALAQELEKHRAKTYEPVPKLDNVYITKEGSELHSDRHKIGKTLDPEKRKKKFDTACARGTEVLHARRGALRGAA